MTLFFQFSFSLFIGQKKRIIQFSTILKKWYLKIKNDVNYISGRVGGIFSGEEDQIEIKPHRLITWAPSLTSGYKYNKYRIYSVNHAEHLLSFSTFRVGTYSIWALIWAIFSKCSMVLFCNKTINDNNKTWRCSNWKARFP